MGFYGCNGWETGHLTKEPHGLHLTLWFGLAY